MNFDTYLITFTDRGRNKLGNFWIKGLDFIKSLNTACRKQFSCPNSISLLLKNNISVRWLYNVYKFRTARDFFLSLIRQVNFNLIRLESKTHRQIISNRFKRICSLIYIQIEGFFSNLVCHDYCDTTTATPQSKN